MPVQMVDERLWAGSEASLVAMLDAQKAIVERMANGSDDDEDEDQDVSHLLSVDNGIATIEVKGTLVNTNAWYNRFFGMVSYDEIRSAFIKAAEDESVQKIVLYGSSGGGAVSGVEDTAKLIRLINDRIKPVVGYAETAASAMYWLMSAAGEIYAGKTSLVGSIGVIAVHKEYSEYFKAEGVGVTVIRAGKEKALANSNEKLTEKGKAQVQQLVDATYTVFVEHVAAMRGKSYEFADTQMADGKEFIGQAAADVGLVDGIMSYSDLLTKLQESTIDQSQKFMDTRGGNSRGLSGQGGIQLSGESTMPQTMTEAQIAAIAAGAPVTATATAETPVVEATAQDQVDPAASAPTEAQAATGTTEAPATQAVADTSGIALLQAQLKDKDEALLQANIQLNDLKNQLAAANVDALRQIVAAANDNMRIALGGSALGAVGTPAELVAAHNELKGQFVNKFKAGGVSAATSQVEGKSVAPAFNAREQAQLAAVRNVK